MILISMMQRFL